MPTEVTFLDGAQAVTHRLQAGSRRVGEFDTLADPGEYLVPAVEILPCPPTVDVHADAHSSYTLCRSTPWMNVMWSK